MARKKKTETKKEEFTEAEVVDTTVNKTPAIEANSLYVVSVSEETEWRAKVEKIILLVQNLLKSPDLDKKLSWWWVLTNLPKFAKFVTDVIKVLKGEDSVVVAASNADTLVLSPIKAK